MSIDGTWKVTMNSPMGAQEAELKLTTDGSSLSGQMVSPQGSIDLSDGTVNGNDASWKAALTEPMPITLEFTATFDGDSVSGNAKLGAFGNASFTGTRA